LSFSSLILLSLSFLNDLAAKPTVSTSLATYAFLSFNLFSLSVSFSSSNLA
jgi:hypothetical protein